MKWLGSLVLSTCMAFGQAPLTLRFGGSVGWFPLFEKEPGTGALRGVGVDVMEELGRRTSLRTEFVDVPWVRLLKMLEAGSVDLVVGAYDNAYRSSNFVYVGVLMKNETRLYVRKGEGVSVKRFEDLRGRTLGKSRGASYGDAFDRFVSSQVQVFEAESKTNLFRMLLAGRVDFVVMDKADASHFLTQERLSERVQPLDFIVQSQDVHLMASQSLRQKTDFKLIAQAFAGMAADGTLKRILARHGGSPP